MLAAGGATDRDIFVASFDATLGTNWFSHDGYGGSNDEVQALEVMNNKVYGYGSRGGFGGIEDDYWDNSGNTSGASIFGSTSPIVVGPGFYEVFFTEFNPNSVLTDYNAATPLDPGFNQGLDIEQFEQNTFSSAGSARLTALTSNLQFNNQQNNPTGLNTLLTNQNPASIDPEAYIGRLITNNAGYYKADEEISDEKETSAFEMTLYPNPTLGDFSLEFGIDVSGDVEIFNSLGSLVYSNSFVERNRINFELSLTSGIYHLRFVSERGSQNISFTVQ